MDTRKAAFAAGTTAIGVGMLAVRSRGSKMHERCKSMQAAERKCPPETPCGPRMNAEEVS